MKTKNNSTSQSGQNRRKPQPKKNERKNRSTINPNKLIQAAQDHEKNVYTPIMSFNQMPIHNDLKANIAGMGFTVPTEIQERTYEHLVAKKNLIGIANTGTGKTGAFLIPVLHNLMQPNQPRFGSLIIVPTRELALQVYDEFKKLARGLQFSASCHIGGTKINADINRLKQRSDVVIGTPGRLLDLMQRGSLKTANIQTLVLDEFDRMLDMGFIQDIRKIVGNLKNRNHTMLFSATMDNKQTSLVNEMVKNPVKVSVDAGDTTSKNVAQDIIRVPQGADKFGMLLNLLTGTEFNKVILFAETKRLADRLSKKLNQSGVKADQIHGNKSQNYRIKALDKFKKGSIRVLVATDVAARGVDVSNVSHVINYQLPGDYDTYIHRIGRTGRAGNKGMAYTFVD